MAPIILTADEEVEAAKNGSSELKFLLDKEGVSHSLQCKLYHVGIWTLAKFASIVVSIPELITVLKDDFGLDSTTGIAQRVEVASVICAYRNAATRTEKVAEYQGELDAKHMTKPLGNSEFLSMKVAWESKWWMLEDRDTPAKCYLERRAEELESGDLRAETLQIVLNRDQDDPDVMVPIWDATGALKMKKGIANIPDPENPEQLRRRLELMGVGLMMLATRHTNRANLQGITPQVMQSYAAYLLGEHVWEMVARDANGLTVAAPNWPLLIAYELSIRKKAYRLLADTQHSFAECLKLAWLDPSVKERNFTTPLALGASSTGLRRKAPEKEWVQPVAKARKGTSKGSAKGGSKGKSKGSKGKGGLSGCAAKSPEGESICFSYNNANVKCKNKECPFAHLCGICFQKHPMWVCKGKGQAVPSIEGDTRGAGAGMQ